jgi:hypothetical protein
VTKNLTKNLKNQRKKLNHQQIAKKLKTIDSEPWRSGINAGISSG